MGRRTVVLHVGTHKTGTTSLQTMLARNEGHFAVKGLYYPAAGRGGGDGHHNLAWELAGDERYDPAAGSLADLVAELAAAGPRAVVVSSEDFEYLHRRPERLATLRTGLESAGYAVRVLVVLREPAGYVESLYAELGKHGLTGSLDGFVEGALASGAVTFGAWTFSLDYPTLVGAFAGAFGRRRVQVLGYHPADVVGSLLAACGRQLGLDLSPVPGWVRFNARDGGPGPALTVAQRRAVESAFGGVIESLVRRYPPCTDGVLRPLAGRLRYRS